MGAGWLDVLVRGGTLTPALVDQARRRQADRGGELMDNLMALGAVDREQLVSAVAQSLGREVAADDDVIAASRGLAQHLPVEVARAWSVVPFLLEDTVLHVALHDHLHADAARAAVRPPGLTVRFYVASPAAVEAAVARLYTARPRAAQAEAPKPAASSTLEVPNRNFGEALGLEEKPGAAAAPATGDPVLLFRKKPTPVPFLLTRKKEEPAPVLSLGRAAERMFEAKDLPDLCGVVTGYLANYFDRALMLDLFKMPAKVVGARNINVALSQREVHRLPGISTMLTVQEPYYGGLINDAEWDAFYRDLGEIAPKTMLVMPVFQQDHARMMVYADSTSPEMLVDPVELAGLARECTAALLALGF